MSGQRPVALITAGWKRIGAAIALKLAQSNYDLALHAHRAESFDDGLRQQLEALGASVHGVAADLADIANLGGLFDGIVAHFGRAPVLLVNNASRFGEDELGEMTADGLAAHLAINLAAPLLLTQALAKVGGGCAVHILDQRIRNPHGDQLSYTISKQALAESVRTLARAGAPGLRVNGVAPGLTLPTADYSDAQWHRLASMMPLQQLPSPDDIAEAVAYLAQAQSVTGQIVYVDGGANLEAYKADFKAL